MLSKALFIWEIAVMRGRRLRQIEDNQAPSKQGRALRILIGLALAANLLAGTANALTANAPGEAAPPNMRAIITANLQRPDLDPTVPAAYSGAVPGAKQTPGAMP